MADQNHQSDDREKLKASPEAGKPPFAEMDLDPSKDWRAQVFALISKGMGEKYKDSMNTSILAYISTDPNYKVLENRLNDVKKIQLDGTKLSFFDEEGKTIVAIEIAQGLKETIDLQKDHDCDICERRARRRLRYSFGRCGFGGLLAQYQSSSEKGGRRTKSSRDVIRPPLPDPMEIDANRRHREMMAQEKVERQDILTSVMQADDNEYDITASVSPTIQDDNAEEFESHWPFMDGSTEIDSLLRERPTKENGYSINPFVEQKWNHETILQLIQGASLFNRNSIITLQEVGEEIYDKHYDELHKYLAVAGVPKVVRDLLDKGGNIISKIPIVGPMARKGESLELTYKNLEKLTAELDGIKDPKNIPEEYKDLYAHREKIRQIKDILGDYIAYGARLVNYLNDLKYRPANETTMRDATMHEKGTDPGRNKVIDSLTKIFSGDVDHPGEYSSEIQHWFSFISPERPINFQDLNGRTFTVEGDEWFTTYLSPKAAYKLAYEAAETHTKNPETGELETKVEPELAKQHLNYLLDLGVAFYRSINPSERSIKKIIEDLAKAGVEVDGAPLRFSGNFANDRTNLVHALEVKDLADLQREDSDAQKAINLERLKFIRIGSVIAQKHKVNHQEIVAAQREKSQRTAVVKFTPEQAESIVQKLRDANAFEEKKLQEIKTTLTVGIGVVVPLDGSGRFGGGLGGKYDLGNGFSLDFTGGYVGAPFAGAGVGKQIDIESDMSVTLHAGAGYVFSKKEGGPMVGGDVTWTNKFEKVDVSVHAGAGALLGTSVIPVVEAGVGFDWAKRNEHYEKVYSKKKLDEHIAELDASNDRYGIVKANPDRYPELSSALISIETIPGLDNASRIEMFNAFYEGVYKEQVQKFSIGDSIPSLLEKLIPTGAGFGLALVNGTVPVPYAHLEFNLCNRQLVFRVATNIADAQAIGDSEATAAILKQYGSASSVGRKQLTTSGEILVDPVSGKLKIVSGGDSEIDFKEFTKYNRFNELRDTLWNGSRLRLEQVRDDAEIVDRKLFLLEAVGAHGNVNIYVDPQLGDDVILVVKGGQLYVSVEKEAKVFFKRQDTTYPFSERGEVEETLVTISANPKLEPEVIQHDSGYYMNKTPTTEWVRRETIGGKGTPEARKAKEQVNVRDWEGFKEWWGSAGKPDRLEFEDMKKRQSAYDELKKTASLKAERVNGIIKIRPEMQEKITKLSENADFIQTFRVLTTEGFDYKRPDKPITADWNVEFPKLVVEIRNRMGGEELTPDELNAAILSFTIASFNNIHNKDEVEAQKKFGTDLDNFGRRLLTSIFGKHYEGQPDAETKTKAAVDFMIDKLKDTNVSEKGESVGKGVLFGSLVGMFGITGIRHMTNYTEAPAEWGVIGREKLNVRSKNPTEKEVALFWLQDLSGYETGLFKEGTIPSPDAEPKKYEKFQERVLDDLHSPFALKLLPLVSVMLDADQMKQLKVFYEDNASERLVTPGNYPVIQRFLYLCDQVREGELAGKKEIPLDGGEFKILITKFDLSMGIYKECGNVTGLLDESFALVHEGRKQIYFAGMGESIVEVKAGYKYNALDLPIGVALLLPKFSMVGGEGAECPPKPCVTPCPPEKQPTQPRVGVETTVPEPLPTAHRVDPPLPTAHQVDPNTGEPV
jgi:hypothetical protein